MDVNRRQFLAASGVGVAAAMAGCTSSALTDDAGAQSGDGNGSGGGDREITVSASGEVESEPDKAIVSVGVEARGETAEAVTDELATGAERLRQAFTDLEIPEENVEEGRYRVGPAPSRDGESEGFRGTHSFEVTLEDVERVGEVIDAAVEAGADDVGHVNFTLQEETRDQLRKEALDQALANADDEAAYIADNRGVELAGTKSVTTGDVNVHAVSHDVAYSTEAAGNGGAPPTEIDAEPVTVSASVTVTYAFDAAA
ncbi:SIMPL domain-containing protein [Halopiger thermotolerans]